MIDFPVSPGTISRRRSIDSWNQELRSSMGACWRVRQPLARNPDVFFSRLPMGELSIMGISVSSSIAYDSAPSESSTGPDRMFFIHMGNTPNHMVLGGQKIVQEPGECMLGDSAIHTSSACNRPHATLCIGVPAGTFRSYLPNAEEFVGKHLDPHSTYSRIVPALLSSLFRMAAAGGNAQDGWAISDGLLRVFARWCALSASAPNPGGPTKRISRQQVKKLINADIRNPGLSVESIARQLSVSTRYLQLLFAQEDDCVSRYIRRERLRGCLLDLRDTHCTRKSITEIAFSWGFNSATHFSSLFSREYGLSARDYRRSSSSQLKGLEHNRIANLLVLASEQQVS